MLVPVFSSVTPSCGAWTAKVTAAFGTGTPSESVTVNVIVPRSWIPDPLRPSTNGCALVTAMTVGEPAGVPGGGGGVPPPPPPGGVPPPLPLGVVTVSCTVLPAEVQLPETKTAPATHRESVATLHA